MKPEKKKFVERRRRPDPVRLGEFCKMLRTVVDGTGKEEVSIPKAEVGQDESNGVSAAVRLPYSDQ